MSATIDANILLHASDTASPYNKRAKGFLQERASGTDLLYLFWPTVMAYLRIATHPGIFDAPLAIDDAVQNVDQLLQQPNVRTGGESEGFWDIWLATAQGIGVRGNLVPDSHLVALMRQYGVGTIWSRDRGLRRFDGVRVRDPFEEGKAAR